VLVQRSSVEELVANIGEVRVLEIALPVDLARFSLAAMADVGLIGPEEDPELCDLFLPGVGGKLLQDRLGVLGELGGKFVGLAEEKRDLIVHDALHDRSEEAGEGIEQRGVHPDEGRNGVLHIEGVPLSPLGRVHDQCNAAWDANDPFLVPPLGIEDLLPLGGLKNLEAAGEPLVVIRPILRRPLARYGVLEYPCRMRQARGEVGACHQVLKNRLSPQQAEAAHLSMEGEVFHDLLHGPPLLTLQEFFRKRDARRLRGCRRERE